MKNLKVQNVYNNGREVANQFIINYTKNDKEYEIFQSYQSMILKYKNGILIEVGSDWDYSRTTGKYRNLISGMDKNTFKKMLDNLFEYNENTQTYIRKK